MANELMNKDLLKMRKKIIIVVGARPNFIKIAPLFWEFKNHSEIIPVLVHTGQHYDYQMSQIFFRALDIPNPDYNLGIGSGSHAVQTAQAMIEIEKVFEKEKPDLTFVVGDVNSTLAAAIVAAKLHYRVAHLEAGPRMFDMTMPEEVNRVLVDHISDLNFCPTKLSVKNLAKEGVKKGVYFSGDTMLDAFLRVMNAAKKNEKKLLEKYSLAPKKYFLLTLHRPANVDDCRKLQNILQAVIKTGENIIFPIQPRTRKKVDKITDNLSRMENFDNIKLIDPVGYTEMVILEKNAKKICTDSGGIQKEAYWLKIPCVTLLESQGWPELHHDGWNILVGSDINKIYNGLKKSNPKAAQRKYFGNGSSAKKILKIILKQK